MKRIVIVGATSGIGLETARLCIRQGWRVGAAGRRREAPFVAVHCGGIPNKSRSKRWTSIATTPRNISHG